MAEIVDSLSPGAKSPNPESMALTPEVNDEAEESFEHLASPDNTVHDGIASPHSSVATGVASPYIGGKGAVTPLAFRKKGTATVTPSAKKKRKAGAIEQDEEGEGDNGEMSKKRKSGPMIVDDDFEDEADETPKKASKKAASKKATSKKMKKAATAKAAERSTPGDESDDAPIKRPNRQRKAAESIASSNPIPQIFAEATSADKMLVEWRAAGKAWKEIRTEWIRLSGTVVKESTLPNRHFRILSNCTVLKEEDKPKLIAAKREVEKAQHEAKWNLIAAGLKKAGGDSYDGGTLRLQYQRIMMTEGITGPSEEEKAMGVVDHDFNGGPLPASPGVDDGVEE